MTQDRNKRDAGADLFRKPAENLVRGFLAYLALTPVIFCWGLLLIVLFIITLASFEMQTTSALTAVFDVLTDLTARFPFLERFALDSPVIDESGVIEINNSNLGNVIIGLYGYMAAPFVILGMLLDLVRGPRPPRALSRKIKIMGLATLAAIAALFTNFLFGSEIWAGSILGWSLMFTLGPGMVYVISIMSLSLHHFISSLRYETGVSD